MALDVIHLSTGSQLLFLSDTLSFLQSLQNQDLSHPPIEEILCRVCACMVLSGGIGVYVGSYVPMLYWQGILKLRGQATRDLTMGECYQLLPFTIH